MANKQINTILSLTDKFSTPLFKVSSNMGKATKDMKSQVAGINKMANKMERRMDKLVKSAFKWGKRMAIAGAGISLKVGWDGIKELDAGARKVKSIAKDALELGEIKDGLLELSGKTGVSVEDLAEAQYMAISSSVDPKDSLAYAELASKMGKAGFADPREAIDLVTSMQNAYGEKGIGSAIKMADQFLHTQNKGKIEIGQMTQYYGKLIPLFSQAAVGYDEMNAAMATLTKMGMKPAEASTALAGAMRIMMKGPATDKQAEKMKELGINFSAAELKAKGFGGMMSEVMKVAGGDMDKLSQIFPNARALLAGATMTGEEGMREYQQILKELQTDTTGALDEAYETIQGSIGNQWDILKQNMKNVNTKFYMNYEGNLAEKLRELNEWFADNPDKIDNAVQRVSDSIGKMIDKIGDFFNFLKENERTVKSVGIFVGTLYGALKALRAIVKMRGAIKSLLKGLSVASLGPVGLAILSIATAVTIVYNAIKKLQDAREKVDGVTITEMGDNIPQLSIAGMDHELSQLTPSEQSLMNIAENLKNINREGERLLRLLEKITDFFSDKNIEDSKFLGILDKFSGPMGEFIDKFKDIKGTIEDIQTRVLEFIEGITLMIEGVMTKDYSKVFEGFKLSASSVTTETERDWNRMVDLMDAPVSAVLDLQDDGAPGILADIRDKWKELMDKSRNPVSLVVSITRKISDVFSGGDGGGKSPKKPMFPKSRGVVNKLMGRYTGDMSWKGGIVQVHEKGGEILDLPGGTRIFPHDRSVRMAYEEGQNRGGGGGSGGSPIVVNFNGDLYGDDEYLVNRVGKGIANKIIAEMANM